MDVALLVARLILSAVLAAAGLAKLADRVGSREAIAGFGVPARLATPLAILLPVVELAVAVALIPTGSAWAGAVGALALLLLFIAAIALNLARGHKPDCRCFGQLHSSPVGWRTLVRNALLAAVAAFVVWQGRDDSGSSATGWLRDLAPAEVAAAIAAAIVLAALAVLGWFVLNLLRQQGRLLLRVEGLERQLSSGGQAAPSATGQAQPEAGLPVGAPAPGFHLSGLHGETLTLDALRAARKPILLLFTDPNCGPCNALAPEVGRWQRAHAADLTIAVITRGTADESRAKSAEHGLANVLLQADNEVADAYRVQGTPSAVIVGPDGTIASGLAGGADEIQALLRSVGTRADVASQTAVAVPDATATTPASPSPVVAAGNGSGGGAVVPPAQGPGIGDPAPPVKLTDVNGRTVNIAGYRGTKTLLLFWNPSCGYCEQMLDDLRAWEADPPAGAPKLIVVSTGTVAENRAMGLRSPVLLDQRFSVAGAFGADGTPMAVLVDEEGRVASDLAAGAPGVMSLAGRGGDSGAAVAAATPKVGEPAPAVTLPDLDGRPLELAEFRGGRTLVLFWNPQCGFCRRMLDDLKAWEANPPPGAPATLIVSAGTPEENRAMGLRSPVVLDTGFSTGTAFGVGGTPSGVLVDEEGRIASEVAVGAPAVLALAGAS
jgi:peroxiredoxin/uncharacterized membrane protein YphA (DoxX/SURF4 family)